jgi:TetR/AcrR family transcriptional repressor of nem operon
MPTLTQSAIVEAADGLFYHRGFSNTSFADISQAVGISRGNFYYHFKSKDEILAAVIAARVERTQAMLAEWGDSDDSPLGRICSFIHIVLRNQSDIEHYGCPVGTLTAEMAKLDHPARDEAAALFTLFREWLRRQFETMGAGTEADALAMHVLAWSQGIATLASALGDDGFIKAEVAGIRRWLDEQAARLAASHGPASKHGRNASSQR